MRRPRGGEGDPVIGARIRDRRIEMGLSQSKLGAIVGCTQAIVSKLERGDMRVSFVMAEALTTALGITGLEPPFERPPGEWRDAPGYEGLYQVSRAGRVLSLPRVSTDRLGRRRVASGYLLKPSPTHGYPAVNLSDADGRALTTRICKLVVLAFIGPAPTPGLEICHNDGDRTNSNVENLRWDTHTANMQDALRHGTNRNAAKTHCKRGHEFTPENTRVGRGGRSRGCKACRRLREAAAA